MKRIFTIKEYLPFSYKTASVEIEMSSSGPTHRTQPCQCRSGTLPHSGPSSPRYATYQARLESFQEWLPKHNQDPSELASAGFFYYGISDQVECFYCEGRLHEWKAEDDPWVDHASLFPECGFIRLVKDETPKEKSAPTVKGAARKKTNLPRTLHQLGPNRSDDANDSGLSREQLLLENQKLKEAKECRVCRDQEIRVVFLPCCHLATCLVCAASISVCVVCRTRITDTVKVYTA